MIFIPFSNRNSDPNWLREAADEEYEASCPCPYVVSLVGIGVAPAPREGAAQTVTTLDAHRVDPYAATPTL
jgi:hypothetical protein